MPSADKSDANLLFELSVKVGVIVIGRNEGERLKRCLRSSQRGGIPVVYVDSGSSDGSAAWAQDFGADVVALDMNRPFTAARARNAGFARLIECHPTLVFAQFVDGDCEFVPQWIDEAIGLLESRPDVAVVCGRLRERFPEQSLYNKMADMEWDRPAGETEACGGIAMYRVSAFKAAEGFRDDMIAGEEPELCLRIRGAGGRVWRMAAEMAWHDSAMTRFGQWWQRAVRGGHALAEGLALHAGASSDGDRRRLRRALGWGMALPLAALGLAVLVNPVWSVLLAAYPIRLLRLGAKRQGRVPSNWAWATFMVLSSFAESVGICKYWSNRLRGRRQQLIEYK